MLQRPDHRIALESATGRVRHVVWLGAVLLMTACATPGAGSASPGESASAVRQRLGAPTAEHALADGQRRLEYSGGTFGRRTLMVDTDAQGRVVRAENVRDEAHFNQVKAGLSQDQLRSQLGEPSRIWGVAYRGQTVWSYRYENPFCQIFNVGLSPQGVVEDTSYGPDPVCEDRERPGRQRGD